MDKKKSLIELGAFLKKKREALLPKIYDLKPDTRRRVKGLKREEIATFSSVSMSLYTWLEQGRDVSVSNDTLERIAKTLKLNDVETKYMFLLAKKYIPVTINNRETKLNDSYQKILNDFSSYPALIMNSQFDILAWNQWFTLIFGDYSNLPENKRNSMRKIFLDPDSKKFFGNWEDIAKRLISVFRTSLAYVSKEQRGKSNELLEELLQNSLEFKDWWKDVKVNDDTTDKKIINHPVLGKLYFTHISLRFIDNPNLCLILYIPANE
jgi:transcriptional regulator with XRE-family HTH domain